MSVAQGNNGKPNTAAPSPQTQTTMGNAMNTAQQSAQQQQSAPGFSFLRPQSLVQTPLTANAAAETLTMLQKAAAEILEDTVSPGMEVKLVPLDAQADARLHLSVLSVAVRFTDRPQLGIGMQNLLLEGSIDRQPPTSATIQGHQIEVVKTAGSADNKATREASIKNVALAFGTNDTKSIVNAMACTVPRDFDLKDTKQIRSLLVNATAAAATELQRHLKGFVDLNLASAAADSQLTVETEYHRPAGVDSVGMPVRSDMIVKLSANPIRTNRDANQEYADRSRDLALVRAFVNMIWAPEQQQQFGQVNNSPLQRYAAQIRLTQLEAGFALTPAAQLFALWVSLAARDNGAWIAAFENTTFGGGLQISKDIDTKDIGAIGYEVNMTPNDPNAKLDIINTKSASFNRNSLVNLVMQTFKPGALVALDVPDAGDSTWYNGVFAAAYENHKPAIDAILNAANQLTNGNFQNLWPATGKIFDAEMNRPGSNRIHFGYFKDADGVKHDIREIDYLAVLNFAGGRNMEIVEQWSNSFNANGIDPEVRLATRLKIMKMMFTDVVITGVGYSLTFSKAFLDALQQAGTMTGLSVNNVSPLFDISNAQRAGANVSGSLLDPTMQTSFVRGNMGSTGNVAPGNVYGQRWS